MRVLRSIAGGVGFLTIVPIAVPVDAASVLGFPLAGLVVAAAVVAIRVGFHPAGGLVVGALALAADAILTRGLHYDALADTADGLAGFMEPEERLAVMDDPRIGALGALALMVIVVVRASVLGSSRIGALELACALAWSRVLMGVVLIESPAVRPDGMARWFHGAPLVVRYGSLGILAVLSGALVLLGGDAGLLGLSCGVIAGGLVWLRAQRALGGVTGDVVGAVGLIAETALVAGMVVGAASIG